MVRYGTGLVLLKGGDDEQRRAGSLSADHE